MKHTKTLTQEKTKMADDGYSLKIEGFKTKEQVEEFIEWYSGSGEQSSATWFECRVADGKLDVDFMPVDCERTFPVKFDADEGKMFLKVD